MDTIQHGIGNGNNICTGKIIGNGIVRSIGNRQCNVNGKGIDKGHGIGRGDGNWNNIDKGNVICNWNCICCGPNIGNVHGRVIGMVLITGMILVMGIVWFTDMVLVTILVSFF